MDKDTIEISNIAIIIVLFLVIVVLLIYQPFAMVKYYRIPLYIPCHNLIGEFNGTKFMDINMGFTIFPDGVIYIMHDRTGTWDNNGTLQDYIWIIPEKYKLTCINDNINVTFTDKKI